MGYSGLQTRYRIRRPELQLEHGNFHVSSYLAIHQQAEITEYGLLASAYLIDLGWGSIPPLRLVAKISCRCYEPTQQWRHRLAYSS